MQRTAKIKATDGSVEIMVEVVVKANGSLADDEIQALVKTAARAIVKELTDLPYSDFGAENTKVTIYGEG